MDYLLIGSRWEYEFGDVDEKTKREAFRRGDFKREAVVETESYDSFEEMMVGFLFACHMYLRVIVIERSTKKIVCFNETDAQRTTFNRYLLDAMLVEKEQGNTKYRRELKYEQ